MSWAFAIVNNRLAEVFFDTKGKKAEVSGHCYVSRNEYKTKQELKWIDGDTEGLVFSYRNMMYRLREDKIKRKTKWNFPTKYQKHKIKKPW